MKVRQLVEADQVASVKRDIIEYIKRFAKRERISNDSFFATPGLMYDRKSTIDFYMSDDESYVTSVTFKPLSKLKKELERKFGDRIVKMEFKEHSWDSGGWRDDSEGGGDSHARLHLIIQIR